MIWRPAGGGADRAQGRPPPPHWRSWPSRWANGGTGTRASIRR